MKFLIISAVFFASVVYASADDAWKEKLRVARKECLDDPATTIDNSLREKLKNREKVDFDQVAKYTKCVAGKLGVLNEDGSINVETVRKVLKKYIEEEPKLNEAVQQCTKDRDNAEKRSLEVIECIRDYLREKDFFKH